MPPNLAEQPQSALLASRHATTSRAAGVSYFCHLAHADPPVGRTGETMTVVALAYAVMRQMMELLPEGEEVVGAGGAVRRSAVWGGEVRGA